MLFLQVKLEEALTLATDFHNSLQDFINWLTQAEQTLNMVSPASLIMDTIMFQIDEHKVLLVQRGGFHSLELLNMYNYVMIALILSGQIFMQFHALIQTLYKIR